MVKALLGLADLTRFYAKRCIKRAKAYKASERKYSGNNQQDNAQGAC